MKDPIRYTPALERPEADTVAGLEKALQEIMETTAKDLGHAIRSVHAKSHSILTATLEVLADLPPELAQGMFARRAASGASAHFDQPGRPAARQHLAAPRGRAEGAGHRRRPAARLRGREHARLPHGERPRLRDSVPQAVPGQPQAPGQDHGPGGMGQDGAAGGAADHREGGGGRERDPQDPGRVAERASAGRDLLHADRLPARRPCGEVLAGAGVRVSHAVHRAGDRDGGPPRRHPR